MTSLSMRKTSVLARGFFPLVVVCQLLVVCSAAQDFGNHDDFWDAKRISSVTLQFATEQWEKIHLVII